jgi:hypothetical protein
LVPIALPAEQYGSANQEQGGDRAQRSGKEIHGRSMGNWVRKPRHDKTPLGKGLARIILIKTRRDEGTKATKKKNWIR